MDAEEKILQGLNEAQRSAVEATEGRVRVVAGAGSGKTKVLVSRYLYLTEVLGINASNILCMTFTNKAAQEMRLRITRMAQAQNVNDFICTIHSFCLKVLRRDIYRLGFPKTFSILDEDDQKQIARQVFESFAVTRQKDTLDKFVKSITAYKAANKTEYIRQFMLPGRTYDPMCDKVGAYLQRQASLSALDFNDIIHFAVYLLQNFKDVLEYWQGQLDYVMMDEGQDCNENDWLLMRLLSAKYGNLFVVGDPDQAIYEWRGAVPQLFTDFVPDHDIMLTRNYRSTANILGVANSIIKFNRNRIDKDLMTLKDSGLQVTHFHAKTEREEAEWVAGQIRSIHDDGHEPLSSFAVLYRSSYLSREVEQALIRSSLPYSIWGGVRFFERREIKDALAYLRLVANGDDLSFLRIINVPSRKLGKAFVERVEALAKAERSTCYETLKRHIADKELNRKAARDFVSLIEDLRVRCEIDPLTKLLDESLNRSGLMEMVRTDGDEDRLENIAELQQFVKSFEQTHQNDEIGLADFLQEIALYTNEDADRKKDTVKLMTVHQSKGLEFPYVFVIGMSEGIFPNVRTIRERKKKGEEEERRLMYVAATRAERALYMTESEGYSSSVQSNKYPSRFLLETENKFVVRQGKFDPVLFDGTRSLVANEEAALGMGRSAYTQPKEESAFKKGDAVGHRHFGQGIVLKTNDDGSCNVKFANFERCIQEKFLFKM